jgi:hypothetical protein
LALVAWLACLGCSGTEGALGSEPQESVAPLRRAPHFVDARFYFQEPEAIDAWYALTTKLRRNFDDVCGDTFCEGDYSNYESLGFRCSVDDRGVIGSCVWLFAASTDEGGSSAVRGGASRASAIRHLQLGCDLTAKRES